MSGTLEGDDLEDRADVTFVAGPAATGTSSVTISPSEILVCGVEASTVTVTLFDKDGNGLKAGGDTVVVSSTEGTVSSLTDVGDGSYTAQLTRAKGDLPGDVTSFDTTITASVGGVPIADEETVTLEQD